MSECKYCKGDMNGEYIESRYAIDIMCDDLFLYCWCDCGKKTVIRINYCPMCGRKFGEDNE